VVHISQDAVFVDRAIDAFRSVSGEANRLVLFATRPERTAATKPDVLIKGWTDVRGIWKLRQLKAEAIVLHSLALPVLALLTVCRRGTPVLWIGWGFDYYDIIDATMSPAATTPRQRRKLRSRAFSWFKLRRIRRIDFFAPVLRSEWYLLREICGLPFPDFLDWNYGSGEDLLPERTLNATGQGILVGNSATETNSHHEAFEQLAKLLPRGHDREIVVPLSYGDAEVRQKVMHDGKQTFGKQFQALVEFLSLEEFLGELQRCRWAIMNHRRQQGLGTIIALLNMGSVVFLREECPTYSTLQELGVIVYSTDQLVADPSLINRVLTDTEVERNRAAIAGRWSRSAHLERTRVVLRRLGCQVSG